MQMHRNNRKKKRKLCRVSLNSAIYYAQTIVHVGLNCACENVCRRTHSAVRYKRCARHRIMGTLEMPHLPGVWPKTARQKCLLDALCDCVLYCFIAFFEKSVCLCFFFALDFSSSNISVVSDPQCLNERACPLFGNSLYDFATAACTLLPNPTTDYHFVYCACAFNKMISSMKNGKEFQSSVAHTHTPTYICIRRTFYSTVKIRNQIEYFRMRLNAPALHFYLILHCLSVQSIAQHWLQLFPLYFV